MNWNLREKLEAARAEQRAGHGLPPEKSPWLVDDGGLPVWTGEDADGSTIVNATGTASEVSSVTVVEGDACMFCGDIITTDMIDLVSGVTDLSCRGCGLRFHVESRA